MATKSRRIGNIVAFTPAGFLTGVGQLADVWGNSSADVYPPRIRHAVKAPCKKSATTGTYSIKTALTGDVRKVGSDISRSIAKYAVSGKKGI
jgi:hypothetical protein